MGQEPAQSVLHGAPRQYLRRRFHARFDGVCTAYVQHIAMDNFNILYGGLSHHRPFDLVFRDVLPRHSRHTNQRRRDGIPKRGTIALTHHPEDENALRDVLKTARDKRDKEATPAAFKVRTSNRKPSIKQDIAAGKKQLERQRAAAPQRTAAKTKNNDLEV
jgi:hypothetical protein